MWGLVPCSSHSISHLWQPLHYPPIVCPPVAHTPQVVSFVDFVVSESCHTYSECNLFQSFLSAGKPVYNVEYSDSYSKANFLATVCPASKVQGISSILKQVDLYAQPRTGCPPL